MREYKDFLSEREIFILEHHPEMSYRAIGEQLGIGSERVRQIKVAALHKIKDEKRREQAAERNKLPVTLTIRRKDLFIIARGLDAHITNMRMVLADQRHKDKEAFTDTDYERACELRSQIYDALQDKALRDRPKGDEEPLQPANNVIPLNLKLEIT